MAVYTPLTESNIGEFIAAYDIGTLRTYVPIAAGIENTNYFLDTDKNRFVLTIFESTPRDALGFYLDLMAFLADNGIPSAHPIANRSGNYLAELKNKPAAIVQRLEGASVEQPTAAQSYEIGRLLARMHHVSKQFSRRRADDRGRAWREQTSGALCSVISASDRELLDRELDAERDDCFDRLPGAVIHADLFRDNALFNGDEITGVIDFYYAHSGPLLYDVAVTLADWAFVANDDRLDLVIAEHIIAGYQSVRLFNDEEKAGWLACMRLAALRFWLSRLYDSNFPRAGEVTQIKNPLPFRRLLEDCQSCPEKYRRLLA